MTTITFSKRVPTEPGEYCFRWIPTQSPRIFSVRQGIEVLECAPVNLQNWEPTSNYANGWWSPRLHFTTEEPRP